MAVSKFIRGIAKKIEEVSGVDPQRSVMPKEVLFFQVEPDRRRVILRTAEETQNMDVVHLKQFDPYFQNSDIEIPCQFPGCSKTRKFVQECESQEKFKKVKRDLFLCEGHRKELTRSVLKSCREQNVTLDVETLKENDFTGYERLIGVLEMAFMHLQSKWRRGVNDVMVAEIFLNTRNFLLITNALLNPDEENTTTVLGPYLTLLLKVLADPQKMQSGVVLLLVVMGMILLAYEITYEWIHIPLANPGARLGTSVGILCGLLALKIFKFTPEEKPLYFLGISVAGGLFGGALFDWKLDPRLIQTRNQQLGLQLYRDMTAAFSGTTRRVFHASGDGEGNLSVDIPEL